MAKSKALVNDSLMTLNEASLWASGKFGRDITSANLSYLINYGRIRKIQGKKGAIVVSRNDLESYYASWRGRRESQYKRRLGGDINWRLSFEECKESETTKHVHRLHPYKGKFIPQLAEYFLDSRTDEFKTKAIFRPGDSVLDPFCGSGTTLVQANELGMHAVGVDVSRFNAMIANLKLCRLPSDKIFPGMMKILANLPYNGGCVLFAKLRRNMTKNMNEPFLTPFLKRVGASESDRVLKSTTYKIGRSHAMVRVRAAANSSGRYFFGIKYTALGALLKLKNPFVVFICGGVDNVVMVPAVELWNNREHLSTNQEGDFRITLDSGLDVALKGKNHRIDCKEYVNRWDIFNNPPAKAGVVATSSVEESMHSVLQGRLLAIGKYRGFSTFCPDKKRIFNSQELSELTDLQKCPELQFSDYKLLRKIDVLWFAQEGKHYLPRYAFEVELSTGIWPGVGRMATLLRYSDVKMYVVSNDEEKYQQVIDTRPEYYDRYARIDDESLGDLYAAELGLASVRKRVGL